MKRKFTTYLLIISLTSLWIMNVSLIQDSTADGEISSEIIAGDTYWYEITEFTGLSELLTDADFPEATVVDGSLVGSSVYVKIINVQNEQITFWDGSTEITGEVPIIDLTGGIITGSSVNVFIPETTNTCNNLNFEQTSTVSTTDSTTEISTVVVTVTEVSATTTFYDYCNYFQSPEIDLSIPSGSGLPLPGIFGSVSQFSLVDGPLQIIPLPFALNDKYEEHEDVLTSLLTTESGVEFDGFDLSVTNSNDNFKVTGAYADVEGSFNFEANWRKSDGVIDFLSINIGSPDLNIAITIELQDKENIGMQLDIGDKFKLELSEFNFDYSFPSSMSQEEIDVTEAEILDFKDFITPIVGKNLMDLEVVDIAGLYYEVEGSIYDPDTTSIRTISDLTNGEVNTIWMSAFGTFHYAYPRLSTSWFAFVDAEYTETCSSTSAEYGYYYTCEGGYEFGGISDEVFRRAINLPGFVISEDYKIYQAYDQSIVVLTDFYSMLIQGLTAEDDVTFDMTYELTSNIQDGGYHASSMYTIDVIDFYSDSQTIRRNEFSMNIQGEGHYDKYGIFQQIELHGAFSSLETFIAPNDATEVNGINFDNIVIKLTGIFDPINERTHDLFDPEDDGEPNNPLSGIPGFEIYLAIIYLGFVVIIHRKRKT